MVTLSLPPVAVKLGHWEHGHRLELSDGTVEKFEDVWARNRRIVELEEKYDAALQAEYEKRQ